MGGRREKKGRREFPFSRDEDEITRIFSYFKTLLRREEKSLQHFRDEVRKEKEYFLMPS